MEVGNSKYILLHEKESIVTQFLTSFQLVPGDIRVRHCTPVTVGGTCNNHLAEKPASGSNLSSPTPFIIRRLDSNRARGECGKRITSRCYGYISNYSITITGGCRPQRDVPECFQRKLLLTLMPFITYCPTDWVYSLQAYYRAFLQTSELNSARDNISQSLREQPLPSVVEIQVYNNHHRSGKYFKRRRVRKLKKKNSNHGKVSQGLSQWKSDFFTWKTKLYVELVQREVFRLCHRHRIE